MAKGKNSPFPVKMIIAGGRGLAISTASICKVCCTICVSTSQNDRKQVDEIAMER